MKNTILFLACISLTSVFSQSTVIGTTSYAVAGAMKYQAQVNNVAVPADKFKKKPVTNSVTINTLTPGSTYSYKVKTICPDGSMSPYSPASFFSTPMRIGVGSGVATIYPNPTGGSFNLELNNFNNREVNLIICNQMNQVVYSDIIYPVNGQYSQQFNWQQMPPGLYYVRLMNDADAVEINLVKQ